MTPPAELFLPLRWYQWPRTPAPGFAGGVIMPSGLSRDELLRRIVRQGTRSAYPRRVLFDPQLYLCEIDVERSRKVAANLETYPWFTDSPAPPLVSGPTAGKSRATARKDWKENRKKSLHTRWRRSTPSADIAVESAVRAAVEFQQQLGVERLILPAPMTRSISTSGAVEGLWADIGLREAARLGQRETAAVTLALSDHLFVASRGDADRAVGVLLDTITARQPGGVYLILEQANDDAYYPSRSLTVDIVFTMVQGLVEAGIPWVCVGWTGVLGLIALGLGANACVTGWRRSERRFSYRDLEDSRGLAYPAYYSHRLLAELDLRDDLFNATRAGFLSRIEDETPASLDLVAALRRGQKPDAVPAWSPTRSNVPASIEHFNLALGRETLLLQRADLAQRAAIVGGWLAEAEILASDLAAKLAERHDRTELKHQTIWRSAFERIK